MVGDDLMTNEVLQSTGVSCIKIPEVASRFRHVRRPTDLRTIHTIYSTRYPRPRPRHSDALTVLSFHLIALAQCGRITRYSELRGAPVEVYWKSVIKN